MKFDGAEANLFTNVFPKTKSGKVELASPYLEEKFGARLPSYRPFTSSYPLILITPASDRRTTSTFGGCTANAETPPLEIHPDDAGRDARPRGRLLPHPRRARGRHRHRVLRSDRPRRALADLRLGHDHAEARLGPRERGRRVPCALRARRLRHRCQRRRAGRASLGRGARR